VEPLGGNAFGVLDYVIHNLLLFVFFQQRKPSQLHLNVATVGLMLAFTPPVAERLAQIEKG